MAKVSIVERDISEYDPEVEEIDTWIDPRELEAIRKRLRENRVVQYHAMVENAEVEDAVGEAESAAAHREQAKQIVQAIVELDRRAGVTTDPSSADFAIDPKDLAAIRKRLRQNYVSQYHALVEDAAIEKAVGNLEAAGSLVEQAKQVAKAIREIDRRATGN